MKGPTDGRIGPNFERGFRDSRTADLVRILKSDSGIHGPPIWSKFSKRDVRIHWRSNRSEFSKGKCRDPWTADLIRMIKWGMQGSLDHWFGPNYRKEMQGSTDDWIGPSFYSWMQGSTDSSFGPNFQKGMQGSTDGRINPNFQKFGREFAFVQ